MEWNFAWLKPWLFAQLLCQYLKKAIPPRICRDVLSALVMNELKQVDEEGHMAQKTCNLTNEC